MWPWWPSKLLVLDNIDLINWRSKEVSISLVISQYAPGADKTIFEDDFDIPFFFYLLICPVRLHSFTKIPVPNDLPSFFSNCICDVIQVKQKCYACLQKWYTSILLGAEHEAKRSMLLVQQKNNINMSENERLEANNLQRIIWRNTKPS